MKVSVVILNWNGAEMMEKYLPSVVASTLVTPDTEVVVADNGSIDNSVDMLHKQFPDVKVVCLNHNYGFADGYNRALLQLDSEYFLLLNSDVEIRDSGWLVPMLEYMDSHPHVAACQPKLLSLRNEGFFEYAGGSGGFIDKFGYPFCRGRVMDKVERDEGQYDNISPLLWATGAALMVRAADYREAGGLDATFFAHMEEIDFCWRLRLLGKGVVCVPQSRAYHLGGATLDRSNPRKTYLNFRNNRLMLYKNLPGKELFSVMTIRLLLDVVAAVQFLLKGNWGDCKAVFKAMADFPKLLPEYRAKRADIQAKSTGNNVSQRCNYFLLWQYYAKGRKKFSLLPDN